MGDAGFRAAKLKSSHRRRLPSTLDIFLLTLSFLLVLVSLGGMFGFIRL
jgi:hypothetical protein